MSLALILSGSPADAHLITTGLGPVYDGISHFLMSPEDLVPAFVLALLAGQGGPQAARRVLFLLPAGWLIGGLAGLSAATAPPADLTWLIFVLLGGLVAAHLRPPGAAVMAIAALLGLFKGFINGSAMSYAGLGSVLARRDRCNCFCCSRTRCRRCNCNYMAAREESRFACLAVGLQPLASCCSAGL